MNSTKNADAVHRSKIESSNWSGKLARINEAWHSIKLLVATALLMLVAGFIGAQWQQRTDRAQNALEQQALIDKFPIARADERAKVIKEFQAVAAERDKREAAQTQAMADLKRQMDEMHDLNAYTLRFLGDRAKLADKRNATMIKQTQVAAAAAVTVQKTAEQIDKKANVIVVKAEEAAATAKAVDKKLETVEHPPQPARPWAGSTGGH